MERDLATRLAETYDLPTPVVVRARAGQGINNIVWDVRAGDADYILKRSQGERDLAALLAEHRLLRWLGGVGLSFGVPTPLAARDGTTLTHDADGDHYALFPRLAGSAPDLTHAAHVHAMGAALAELHAALSQYAGDTDVVAHPFGDVARIHPRVPDPWDLTPRALGLPDTREHDALLGWWRDELADLWGFIDSAYRALPWQTVHGDFDPSNTLVEGERVTAILDFEFAGRDARAIDVASALKFTLRVWETADWPCRARWLGQGYASRGHLTPAEVAALPTLLRLRDVGSTIWWLGKALAAGDARPALRRIAGTREARRWLDDHGARLVAEVWTGLTGLTGAVQHGHDPSPKSINTDTCRG